MTGMMEASRAVRRKGRGLAMPRQADCVARFDRPRIFTHYSHTRLLPRLNTQ